VISTYRLTKLINDDYIFDDLRQKLFKKYPRESKIGYLFTCPWCMSIWAAGALLILHTVSPKIYEQISLILTASAVTGIIETRL